MSKHDLTGSQKCIRVIMSPIQYTDHSQSEHHIWNFAGITRTLRFHYVLILTLAEFPDLVCRELHHLSTPQHHVAEPHYWLVFNISLIESLHVMYKLCHFPDLKLWFEVKVKIVVRSVLLCTHSNERRNKQWAGLVSFGNFGTFGEMFLNHQRDFWQQISHERL